MKSKNIILLAESDIVMVKSLIGLLSELNSVEILLAHEFDKSSFEDLIGDNVRLLNKRRQSLVHNEEMNHACLAGIRDCLNKNYEAKATSVYPKLRINKRHIYDKKFSK